MPMSMRQLQYRIVDVFTDRMFGGNPLAVFLEGGGVSDTEMQSLAKEMNLSETTFVLPPTDPANHFNVRIFTPSSELPMAGHPTIGTSFVLAREGRLPDGGELVRLRLEEKVGVIPVDMHFKNGEPEMIWMTQPRPKFGPQVLNRQTAAEMLTLDAADIDDQLPIEIVSCGVPYPIVPVRSLAAVRRLRFRADVARRELAACGRCEALVFTREVENAGSTVHSRMFAPEFGVPEDPATGSAAGPLGAYLVKYRVVRAEPTAAIVNEQGIEMGRPSFLHVRITQEAGEITNVQVGGTCVFVGSGTISLPA
jgi:trans-2,3-dihydro-3-hydroxyanthranilate isomerase